MAGDLFGYSSFQAVSAESDGVSRSPVYTFESELSLGFYRSAASNIALSYGTLTSRISSIGVTFASDVSSAGTVRAGAGWFSNLSVGGASGYTGTTLLAFSANSFLMPAQVIQGSASTFTVYVWPAVRIGDAINLTPALGTAASSMSSGLVYHSHCTQAGQCEIRISNVSTLVQNQSAQSFFIYRWSAF